MTLLMPDTGEVESLKRILNYSATGDVVIKLFKSNTTPAETDTAATYTEATFTGYAAGKTLAGASWTITAGAPGASLAAYAIQTWTSTADQTTENVYGYYVVNGAGTVLMWAERFSDAPWPITNNGDAAKVTPKITLD